MDGIRWLISDLQPPPLLTDLGLAAGLRRYVEGYQKRSGIEVDLDIDELTERLPATMEVAIFRIVQEALRNALIHAEARKINIRIIKSDGDIKLLVKDDGKGFDPSKEEHKSVYSTANHTRLTNSFKSK